MPQEYGWDSVNWDVFDALNTPAYDVKITIKNDNNRKPIERETFEEFLQGVAELCEQMNLLLITGKTTVEETRFP